MFILPHLIFMKPTFYTLLLIVLFVSQLTAQDEEVLWANTYTVSDCIEVGGLAVDSSSNIIISGVYNAPFSLPFKGDVYLKKTDPDGNIVWQNNIEGEVIIGDMISINEDIVIAGQGYGIITYNGTEYGGGPYYLYVLRLDSDGNVLWFYADEDKLGTYANIAKRNEEETVVHARTQSNQGDWILVFDNSGNIVQSRLLHPTETLIDDVACYEDQIFMSGDLNEISGITIDTIYIPQSPLESTAFVLCLDESLTGSWLTTDTTLNNSNGKIEVNENGVFVFQETLDPPFSINSYIKNFTYSGELIKEVQVPVFSNGAALLPSMTLAGDRIALFVKNSFSSDNFKVLIYNEDLEIVNDKTILGSSDQYSNHIHFQNKNFIISHVYESQLNLNDELILPYEGSGKQPYIAKIGVKEVVISNIDASDHHSILIYPNPANDFISVKLPEGTARSAIQLFDITGKIVLSSEVSSQNTRIDVGDIEAGIYFAKIGATGINAEIHKVIIQ